MTKVRRRASKLGNSKAKIKTTAVTAAVADTAVDEAVALAGVFAFGEEMLRKNALDPAYAAVHGAELPLDQVKRLVLAYCLFYHLGLAAYLSEREGAKYWRVVEEAARNDRPPCETDKALSAESWPRVADRRHFRGPKCVEAVQSLARKFPRPEDLIDSLITPEPGTDVLWASMLWSALRSCRYGVLGRRGRWLTSLSGSASRQSSSP
jgi:hypothetical protein